MLNLNSVAAHQQIPLIYVVHEDDELLANSPEAEWYKILQNLPWEQYRSIQNLGDVGNFINLLSQRHLIPF